MGLSYMLNVIALPDGRVPDWVAAEKTIEQLALDDHSRYFDYWEPDGDSREATQSPEYLPSVRDELLERLTDLRDAVTGGNYRKFGFAGNTLFATGGASVGEVPSALVERLRTIDEFSDRLGRMSD